VRAAESVGYLASDSTTIRTRMQKLLDRILLTMECGEPS
jgi:hypothetical protein